MSSLSERLAALNRDHRGRGAEGARDGRITAPKRRPTSRSTHPPRPGSRPTPTPHAAGTHARHCARCRPAARDTAAHGAGPRNAVPARPSARPRPGPRRVAATRGSSGQGPFEDLKESVHTGSCSSWARSCTTPTSTPPSSSHGARRPADVLAASNRRSPRPTASASPRTSPTTSSATDRSSPTCATQTSPRSWSTAFDIWIERRAS